MIRRAGPALRLLLATALLYGSGAHWLLIQGGAWAGMLAARSGRETVARALTTTFDGAHPCRVCRLVKRGAASDSAPDASVSSPSVDFAFVSVPALVPAVEAARIEEASTPFRAAAPPAPLAPPPNLPRAA